ncbi:MAG: alpha/beta hydrolase [Candidatus Thiodiazotropha taylori]|nr:alpha/beta hydrolase [Candidatus Thiodiazotropha taylori]
MNVTIYTSLSESINREIHRLLQKHSYEDLLFHIKILYEESISECRLNAGGIEAEDFIEHFYMAHECEKQNLNVLLVSSPLNVDQRIIINCEEKIAIISTYGLTEEKNISKNCAILTLAATIRYKEKVKCEGKIERCALSPSIYQDHVPKEVCQNCSEKLPNRGAKFARVLHGIGAGKSKIGQLVLVQHGIQTYAKWAEPVAKVLDKNGFNTKIYRYGFFPIFRLVLNKYYGVSIKDRFLTHYKNAQKLNPYDDISVIAHSYGTLLIAQVLKERPEVVLDKLILVNGIVPRDYDWDALIHAGRINRVLNECGDKDIAPILAEKAIPGAGASGTLFFDEGSEEIINTRYKDCGHSTLLSVKHCDETWREFLVDDHWQCAVDTPSVKKIVQTFDRHGGKILGIFLILLFSFVSYMAYIVWPWLQSFTATIIEFFC